METGVPEATAHAEELLSMALTCSVQWAIGKALPHQGLSARLALHGTLLLTPSRGPKRFLRRTLYPFVIFDYFGYIYM